MPHPPQIPLTPQTDERNFPRWEGENAPPGRSGCRYPKMLTRIATREDREQWINANRRVDQNTRQEYWENTPPRVNAPIPLLTTQEMVDAGLAPTANEPIIARDAHDEAKILAFLGLAEPEPPPRAVSIPIADFAGSFPGTPSLPKKRGGRPKGSKNKPKPEVSEL